MIDPDEEVEKYGGPERRRGPSSTWTLWKEIYGTLIGTAPFIIMLVVWGSTVQNRLVALEIEATHLKDVIRDERANIRAQNDDQNRKLDRISQQIESLQQDVARESRQQTFERRRENGRGG